MTPREVAIAYVRAFAEGDTIALAHLLAAELRFSGPLLETTTADSYLKALRAHPLPKCGHDILSVTDDGEEVAVFYDYHRPGGTITIAQRFRVRGGEIVETHLVFDTAKL